MRKDYYTNSKDYINRWVVSYADFVTMLLALFLVMFAISQSDNDKAQAMQQKVKENFKQEKVDNAKGGKPQGENEEIEEKNVTKYQEPNNANINLSKDEVFKIFQENFIDNESITLLKEERGLVVRVNNQILFNPGSAIVKPEAKKTIAEIVEVLTKIDNPVIIEGHTDSTPIKTAQYSSNWELSTARATNIIYFMTKDKRISPKRLSALGYGEYMPIAPNTSPEGRNANRRVDIIVLEK